MTKRIGKKTRTNEFKAKQETLALFLFGLGNGSSPDFTIDDLKEFGSYVDSDKVVHKDKTYYKNYMADADDILRSNPHLLTLPSRERMGL